MGQPPTEPLPKPDPRHNGPRHVRDVTRLPLRAEDLVGSVRHALQAELNADFLLAAPHAGAAKEHAALVEAAELFIAHWRRFNARRLAAGEAVPTSLFVDDFMEECISMYEKALAAFDLKTAECRRSNSVANQMQAARQVPTVLCRPADLDQDEFCLSLPFSVECRCNCANRGMILMWDGAGGVRRYETVSAATFIAKQGVVGK